MVTLKWQKPESSSDSLVTRKKVACCLETVYSGPFTLGQYYKNRSQHLYTDGQKNCRHSFDGTVILFNVSLM
jgi:hypothetical protein